VCHHLSADNKKLPTRYFQANSLFLYPIKEQNFSSTTEIMEAIKDLFKEVLQEVMEAELFAGHFSTETIKKGDTSFFRQQRY
jgi:hypothetical protein